MTRSDLATLTLAALVLLTSPGTPKEHFDIALSKRALAVRAGAVEITWREAAQQMMRRRSVLPGERTDG